MSDAASYHGLQQQLEGGRQSGLPLQVGPHLDGHCGGMQSQDGRKGELGVWTAMLSAAELSRAVRKGGKAFVWHIIAGQNFGYQWEDIADSLVDVILQEFADYFADLLGLPSCAMYRALMCCCPDSKW
jgi:hypothetical protein